MKQTLIISHAPCPDGFGAAYAAWLVYGDTAEYVGADHGHYPDVDVRGRDVFILDFSFPRAMLEAMRAQAKSLVILDHHKSAQKELAGFPDAIFDMDKSGARLAWEHFHPGLPVPMMLQYIEDRDIWVWNHKAESEPFLSFLDTQPYDFELWHKLANMSPEGLAAVAAKGRHMLFKFNSLTEQLAAEAEPVRLMGIDGHKVNGSNLFGSFIGDLLYQKNGTFAMIYRIQRGKLYVSLRAKKGTIDVSEIAAKFGGGGHAAAAAFKFPLGSRAYQSFMAQYIVGNGEPVKRTWRQRLADLCYVLRGGAL